MNLHRVNLALYHWILTLSFLRRSYWLVKYKTTFILYIFFDSCNPDLTIDSLRTYNSHIILHLIERVVIIYYILSTYYSMRRLNGLSFEIKCPQFRCALKKLRALRFHPFNTVLILPALICCIFPSIHSLKQVFSPVIIRPSARRLHFYPSLPANPQTFLVVRQCQTQKAISHRHNLIRNSPAMFSLFVVYLRATTGPTPIH